MKLTPRSIALSGLVLLGLGTLPAVARAQAADPRHGLDAEESAVLARINAYRAANGLGPVVTSPLLNAVAYDHSADMGTRHYFDHVTPEGQSPFDRMRAGGYEGGAMGENLAAGNADAPATFEQWRTSPHHNAAMLNGEYHVIGIGRVEVRGSQYRYYWTTVFGDQLDDTARAALSPAQPPPTVVAAPAPAQPAAPPAADAQDPDDEPPATSAPQAPAQAPLAQRPSAPAPGAQPPAPDGSDDDDAEDGAPNGAPQAESAGDDAPPVEFLPPPADPSQRPSAGAQPCAAPTSAPATATTPATAASAPVAAPAATAPAVPSAPRPDARISRLRIPVGQLRAALRHPRVQAAIHQASQHLNAARAHLPPAARVIVVDIERADRAED